MFTPLPALSPYQLSVEAASNKQHENIKYKVTPKHHAQSNKAIVEHADIEVVHSACTVIYYERKCYAINYSFYIMPYTSYKMILMCILIEIALLSHFMIFYIEFKYSNL